jgi:hypothetical protein
MKEKQKSIMYLGIKTPFAALIKVLKFITMSLISMLQVQCTHPSMYLCYLQLPYSAPYLAGVLGVPEHPRNLADQLTLFKPRGADHAPHITARHPRFQKAKYGSGF